MKPKTANDIKVGNSLEIENKWGLFEYVNVTAVRKTSKSVFLTVTRSGNNEEIRMRKTTEVMIV